MVTDTENDMPGRSVRGGTPVALAVILAAALGMRLWGIGAQSLWHDEVLTTLSATAPFPHVLDSVERNENKPPLYFIVMNLWVRGAGLSETALRLPSARLGVAAVGVMFLIGRDMFDDRRVGLIGGLLLAFSRYHIAYSQEARTYSLMFLLMLLSTWFAVRMIKRDAVGDQIAYVISAALAMYAHPFAAFALLALNLFYVACYLFQPKPATDLRRWVVLQFAFSLLFWPWMARTWLVVKTGLPWIMQSTSFPQAMLSYAGSMALAGLLVVLIGVALGYALVKRERGILLLVLLIVLPILGPLAFSSRLYQTFIPRYGIVVVGALLLLAAYGIGRLRPWVTVLLCVAYAVISLAHFRPGHGNYPGAEQKADMRGAARHILAHAGANDAVWNPSEVLFDRPINHYLGSTGLTLFGDGESPDPQRFPRLWVFYDHLPHEGDPFPAGYSNFRMKAFDGIILYELAVRPEPTTIRSVREDSTRASDSATVPPPR